MPKPRTITQRSSAHLPAPNHGDARSLFPTAKQSAALWLAQQESVTPLTGGQNLSQTAIRPLLPHEETIREQNTKRNQKGKPCCSFPYLETSPYLLFKARKALSHPAPTSAAHPSHLSTWFQASTVSNHSTYRGHGDGSPNPHGQSKIPTTTRAR